MTTAWFYMPTIAPGECELPPDEARHASLSRRLRPDDEISLFDGQGRVAKATILPPPEHDTPPRRGKRTPATRVRISTVDEYPPPQQRLSLIVAGCKGPRLDWLVEKSTELGVTRIILAEFEHSIVRVGDSHLAKLNRTSLEACKQAHRPWLPKLCAGVSLADATAMAADARLIIADLPRAAQTFHQALRNAKDAPAHHAVVIGPEGGLSASEIDWLIEKGGVCVSLGPHILRVETAAIATAAVWAASAHSP